MCGIVGLHLRSQRFENQMGDLRGQMLVRVGERGPDSAGVGLYGDETLTTPGWATVSVLSQLGTTRIEAALSLPPDCPVTVTAVADVRVVSAAVPLTNLVDAVRSAVPGGIVIGTGEELAVLKGVGTPSELATRFALAGRHGRQGVGHARMATESAVTLEHGHPFCVSPDLCLVHNGSFANHDTIRRELAAEGVVCDTDNDSEVAARFLGWRLALGDDLEKSLRLLCDRFEGFYTLLVTTANEFAVVRDAIACKPAVIAESPDWVAMASEYRALAVLPGIERARVFEPGPEEVHLWAD